MHHGPYNHSSFSRDNFRPCVAAAAMVRSHARRRLGVRRLSLPAFAASVHARTENELKLLLLASVLYF